MPPTILLKSKLYYKIEQITIIIKTLMTKYNNYLFELKGILIKVQESFKPLVNKLKTNGLPVYYDLVKLNLSIK